MCTSRSHSTKDEDRRKDTRQRPSCASPFALRNHIDYESQTRPSFHSVTLLSATWTARHTKHICRLAGTLNAETKFSNKTHIPFPPPPGAKKRTGFHHQHSKTPNFDMCAKTVNINRKRTDKSEREGKKKRAIIIRVQTPRAIEQSTKKLQSGELALFLLFLVSQRCKNV